MKNLKGSITSKNLLDMNLKIYKVKKLVKAEDRKVYFYLKNWIILIQDLK